MDLKAIVEATAIAVDQAFATLHQTVGGDEATFQAARNQVYGIVGRALDLAVTPAAEPSNTAPVRSDDGPPEFTRAFTLSPLSVNRETRTVRAGVFTASPNDSPAARARAVAFRTAARASWSFVDSARPISLANRVRSSGVVIAAPPGPRGSVLVGGLA
jgi:hypothetical protein